MSRSGYRALLLAVSLALLAGYVDALGYLFLNGFFVSFMSGNSTKLSVGVATADRSAILTASALIALFVAGVIAGTLTGREHPGRRRRVLLLVAALLVLAALSASLGRNAWAIGLATAALGAANNVVQKAGSISISVTYMTGTLVKMGQGIAAALSGGPGWAWVPYALLWASLTLGAVAGAAVYPLWHLQGLWPAAMWCGALTLIVRPNPAREE